MTSLTDLLPILDQAVPALPGKVETVAEEADAFEQEARGNLAALREKRVQAEALADQVRQALDALRDQAAEEEQQLEAASQSLHETSERAVQGVEEAGEELRGAGHQVGLAGDALESRLVQAGDLTRTAQDDARAALDTLGEQARTSRSELEAPLDEMTAAVESAQQAMSEAQRLASEGVSALTSALTRLVGDARDRLGHTHQLIDELRAEQERVVGDALSALDTGRQEHEQEVTQRLDSDVEHTLNPELDGVVEALGELGQQVLQLQGATESRRQEMEGHLTALDERIPPLQDAAAQVKRAADQVGIAWP